MFPPRKTHVLPLPGRDPLILGERTLVMGILNITPDSFSDGGLRLDPARAIDDGLRMVQEGADILDIGGESTRPGAPPLAAEEEMRRVLPVIEGLAAKTRAPLSIDTYKASVAREAIARGAVIVNDISGLLFEPELARVAAEARAAMVLMHNRGRSADMYQFASYEDVPMEIARELADRVQRARAAGVARDAIVLDPGFGFSKRAVHSFEALARLDALAALDLPILSGPSRKSFLASAMGERLPRERDWGTAAAVTASVLLGAHIVRVHAVREMVDVVRVADQIRTSAT